MTKLYLIWLLLVFGEGSPLINELLDKFGTPENVYKAFEDNIAAIGPEYTAKADSVPVSEAEEMLEALARRRISVITMDSPFYPEALKSVENPPCALFARGSCEILKGRLLTVVGSRSITHATYYTQSCALEELMRSFTPVTTLSTGCDELTAMTAIRLKVPCVAVLPCGHDTVYPKDAFVLQEEVVRGGGCLLTEYLPDKPAAQGNFLRRGRILGGISRAALIAQAGITSGALVTAGYSRAPFFLPPPDLFRSEYAGAVGAIRNGGKLFFDARDIEAAFKGELKPAPAKPASMRPAPAKRASRKKEAKPEEKAPETEKLSPESFDSNEHYLAYSAVAESGGAVTFDEIMYKTGIDLDALCEVLLELEISGHVAVTAGSRYRLTR